MTGGERVLVTGAGGFIGGHLVADLIASGSEVRAVDRHPAGEWEQRFADVENLQLDLRSVDACREAATNVDRIYNLAADMGGMGFIEHNKALCMLSVLINAQMLEAARDTGVGRYFFASSACVYPIDRQADSEVRPLREMDAYPAQPEDGYGWEKLFSERLCRHFREDFGLETRVARYHNVYGPLGSFEGGREKAPAALCRKIATAKLTGEHEIEVWGDGEQTRSFTYVDDCVEGTRRIMDSEVTEPLNLGSSELVTINELIEKIEQIAGIEVERVYDTSKPQGVRGRNSDNTVIAESLGWEPRTLLDEGLPKTYTWIYDQLASRVGTAL